MFTRSPFLHRIPRHLWRALSFEPFAVQAEVETFALRFFGDAQSDRCVNDLEDNVAADAADKQGSQHTVDLDHQVGIDAADILDVEHAGKDRTDYAANAVHTERIQRVVVAEHLLYRRRRKEAEYARCNAEHRGLALSEPFREHP